MSIIDKIVAKDEPKEQPKAVADPFMYTEDQLMARLRFFIGICLALTLTGIVFVVLYSIIFVTQPLNAISPIDQKFFELIIPIATFLTGTLSGIMLAGKDDKTKSMSIPPSIPTPSLPIAAPTSPVGGPGTSFKPDTPMNAPIPPRPEMPVSSPAPSVMPQKLSSLDLGIK